MKQTIYVGMGLDDFDLDLTMAHELAHARHDRLGYSFSQGWDTTFTPFDEEAASNDLVLRSGQVNTYAATRAGVTKTVIPNTIEFKLYGWKDDPSKPEIMLAEHDPGLVSRVSKLVHEMPNGLLTPGICIVLCHLGDDLLGVYFRQGQDPLWHDTTEDVATSLEHLYGLYHYPGEFSHVAQKLRSDQDTRRRLELLVEYDFLDNHYLQLLD